MTTYTWTISALDCKPAVGDLQDYVVTSHWRCNGISNNYTGTVYSTTSFEVNPDKPNFTPFNQITEAMAIQWTKDSLGEEQVAAVYSSIDSQIETQINPSVITPSLPWI